MKNEDTKNGDDETPGDLLPTAPKAKTAEKPSKTNSTTKKSNKQQKKSLWWHWKSASRANQIKWFAKGVGVITGICILIVYIVGVLQTKRNFEKENRAHVIFPRPPQLTGPFMCFPDGRYT